MDFDIELFTVLKKRRRISDGIKPAKKKKRFSLNWNLGKEFGVVSVKVFKRSTSGGLYRVFV